jgi:PAS domain S-box-containing protein
MANLASIALLPLAAPALVPNLGVLATPLAANAIGVVLALFATHQRDQIERERLAQASESEERLHLALEAARMGTWEWDVVADRVRQSERAANLLGLAPHEQEGGIDVLMGRVHPDDRRQVRAAIDAAVASGGQYGSEFRVALPDGTIRWMEGRGRAETDAAGRTVRMRGTRMDVTERRTAQEALSALTADLERRVASRTAELERANRALEAFSYSVSHDLRAPIRAISGFATMLEERHAAALDPDARRLLAVVLENASRAGRLIDDLLRLSRLSRQEMVRERIDMNALVREVVENVRQAEPARDVDVVVDDLPAAHGDRALLRQALENLLANAFKFTRPRARASVRVSGVSTPGAVRYTVRDDGVGFDMKYAGKLFDVFQRLHGEREFEGTGVGLAIVARIVERHGGTVTGEGRVDEGASFAFTLPAGSS